MSAQHPLQSEIERYFAAGAAAAGDPAALRAFTQLRDELNHGRLRAAEPDATAPLGWRVNSWVKRGILLGFRIGQLTAFGNHDLSFVDKDTFPARSFNPTEGIRVVPGGSSVREGAYLARGVRLHAADVRQRGCLHRRGHNGRFPRMVGSCAQIGRRVHLSAAAQVGGVLER